MFKNKAALSITAIAIVALMIVGATLAWFTNADSATNVVTFGSIVIDVKETDPDDPTKEVDGVEDYEAMPGDTIDKDPYVKNTGNNDAYVRAKVTISTDATLPAGKTLADFVSLGTLGANWAQHTDGFYYYVAKLDSETSSSDLFQTVSFSDDMGNEFAEKTITIKVDVAAIQAENVRADDTAALSVAEMVGFDWPAWPA